MSRGPQSYGVGNAGAAVAAHASGAPRVFRAPLGPRLLSLFGTIVLAAVSVIMIVFAFLSFKINWALGLFMTAMAGFMIALSAYVWRDLRGKWGFSVAFGPDAVALRLPAGRSLIHRPPAQRLTIPYADIAAIETRLEAYGSLGMEIMQRAYALRRRNGDLIFLCEERALATPLEHSMFTNIVAGLVALPNVEVCDLGMVEGRGGLLAVWGVHSPDWAAPSLAPERQKRLWARAAATGSAAMIATTAATSAWYGGLRAPAQSASRSPPAPAPRNET